METQTEVIKQGTWEWLEQRRGKFTASAVHHLMGKRGMGKTGETYVMEKVTEELGVPIPEVSSYAMQHGTEWEPMARQYYEIAFKCEVEQVGFIIASWCPDAGCSPDGFVRDTNKMIEIKCPYNPVVHTKHLLIKSAADLLELHPEYYWQIQMGMAVTGKSACDFVSFHPEFSGWKRMISIEIKPNEADIILLKHRISEAVQMKNEILKQIEL